VKPPFELGLIVATGCAVLALAKARTQPEELLERHSSAADFGEVDTAQVKANLEAIKNGGQVRSVYRLTSGEVLHVVSEVGVTTSIVCPGEE
jgi:hypothetical protein